MSKDFAFDLYRLNKRLDVGEGQQILPLEGFGLIETDEDIVSVFVEACHPAYGVKDEVPTAVYFWSFTNDAELTTREDDIGQVVVFQITRSTVQKIGPTPTEDGKTVVGVSDIVPPQSVMAQVLCFMQQHLVIVEDFSELMQSAKWIDMFHTILDAAASEKGYLTKLRTEVIPRISDLEASFNWFDKLTRLSVTLWLPNPEVPEDAKNFYKEMEDGGIRKFKQDMSNPNGLSRVPGRLPHAAMSIAQAGYKEGEVLLVGEKDGSFQEVRTGTNPCHGEMKQIRDYVRGMHGAIQDPNTKKVLKNILQEIDRIRRDE